MYDIIQLSFLTLISACLGSFFNMLIYRLPREMDIVWKRSHCPKCQHRLSAIDLIPLLSFLFQKGRCRYCKTRIPFRYFLVECLTPFIFLICAFYFQNSFDFMKYCLFFYIALLGFFCDFETKILPNTLTYGLIISGLSLAFIERQGLEHLQALFICTSIFILIERLSVAYYKQATFGWGDIKLCAGLAAYWGINITALSMCIAVILGGIVATFLLISKKASRKSYIAFGPFIITASLIVLKYQDQINYYYGF